MKQMNTRMCQHTHAGVEVVPTSWEGSHPATMGLVSWHRAARALGWI